MSLTTKKRLRRGLIATGLAVVALVSTDVIAASATTGGQNWSPDASATERVSIAPLSGDGVRIYDAPATTTASASAIEWAAGSHAMPTAVMSARAFFHLVNSEVNGARMRAKPVNGTVLALIPLNYHYWMICKHRFSDGYYWGYGSFKNVTGWVRADLWTDIAFTHTGEGGGSGPDYDPTPEC